MEGQELFNTMMRAAVACLQEEGLLPNVKKNVDENGFDWESPEGVARQTKILQDRGLLPKK